MFIFNKKKIYLILVFKSLDFINIFIKISFYILY